MVGIVSVVVVADTGGESVGFDCADVVVVVVCDLCLFVHVDFELLGFAVAVVVVVGLEGPGSSPLPSCCGWGFWQQVCVVDCSLIACRCSGLF